AETKILGEGRGKETFEPALRALFVPFGTDRHGHFARGHSGKRIGDCTSGVVRKRSRDPRVVGYASAREQLRPVLDVKEKWGPCRQRPSPGGTRGAVRLSRDLAERQLEHREVV